eukprot:4843841-Amphidinium_carterae.2
MLQLPDDSTTESEISESSSEDPADAHERRIDHGWELDFITLKLLHVSQQELVRLQIMSRVFVCAELLDFLRMVDIGRIGTCSGSLLELLQAI